MSSGQNETPAIRLFCKKKKVDIYILKAAVLSKESICIMKAEENKDSVGCKKPSRVLGSLIQNIQIIKTAQKFLNTLSNSFRTKRKKEIRSNYRELIVF